VLYGYAVGLEAEVVEDLGEGCGGCEIEAAGLAVDLKGQHGKASVAASGSVLGLYLAGIYAQNILCIHRVQGVTLGLGYIRAYSG
jgi:hypothetical protein